MWSVMTTEVFSLMPWAMTLALRYNLIFCCLRKHFRTLDGRTFFFYQKAGKGAWIIFPLPLSPNFWNCVVVCQSWVKFDFIKFRQYSTDAWTRSLCGQWLITQSSLSFSIYPAATSPLFPISHPLWCHWCPPPVCLGPPRHVLCLLAACHVRL